MFETELQIQFLSDWHVGSGLGDGAIADAILVRDVYGIPYIPGSAIKGALREGAWRLARCSSELVPLTEFLFGAKSDPGKPNQPSRIILGQGRLEKSLIEWLSRQDDLKEFIGDMTIIRQQTRLDSRKMIVPHSLRSIECGIPGIVFNAALSARLPEDANDWFAEYLGAICACVKSIGGYRSRGIGCCSISFGGNARAVVPGSVPGSVKALMETKR